MLEIFVKREDGFKKIALVENGVLVEYYEEDIEDDIKKEGNIYIGIIKNIIPGMQTAFVDIGNEKNALIHNKDVMPKRNEAVNQKIENYKNINELVKVNQKILIQVKKDSNEQKGARVSTHINLPGKYIVLMPNTDIVTVSQKIENEEEQKRLINLVKENISEGNGAVIRTAAEGKNDEIVNDIKYLENKWDNILKTSVNPDNNKPQLLYKSQNIIEKMLLDLSSKKIKNIVVSDKEDYNIVERMKNENKEYENIKITVKNEETIFDIYDLNKQINKIKSRKIWLKCGGFITIDKTEALTAIDVNTGKYLGKKNMEETIYRVNEEATIEIAKQLRLRDIGGIVIIDYIDMEKESNKDAIMELWKQEIKKDRSKVQVEGFTKLDLLELTRKHVYLGI